MKWGFWPKRTEKSRKRSFLGIQSDKALFVNVIMLIMLFSVSMVISRLCLILAQNKGKKENR